MKIWKEENSTWEDYDGQAFFINDENEVEWFRNGTISVVGDDAQQMVYFVSNRLAHIIKKSDKSVWKWKYGAINKDWEKIGENARSIW